MTHLPRSNTALFILSTEVILTEKLPVLDDKGDIMLLDFSQYLIGMRREVTLDKSGLILFDKDETAFRGIVRTDAMGRWKGPASPWTGSETMSWYVTLDARI